MKSKKRLVDALNHCQPDKVPVDFGGTLCSGMHVTCVSELRDCYGLKKEPIKIHEPFQMLGFIDDDLKEVIGVDVEAVNPPNNIFGFENVGWKEYRLDNGLDVLVPKDFNVTKNPNGDTFIYPKGDTSVPPSGHMPYGGYYFDAIIRQEQIDDDNLRVEDNLEEFQIFCENDVKYFKKNLIHASSTGRGVLANLGGTGLGDVALIPGPFMKSPKGIRDIEEWYISTAIRQDYLMEIFQKQTDIAIENMNLVNNVAGELIDVIFICGTDFGTQTGTFCSQTTFNELYMPFYKKMNNWIHKNTNWKTFKHCCGAVEPFMSLFIDAGFDIINPVQCSAQGMDPKKLKEKYGDKLTFWGGGVDTQQILPFGSKDDVRRQVLERCEIFSRNGGFVFNAIHNVQARTPVENIKAMIDAVHEYNGDKVF